MLLFSLGFVCGAAALPLAAWAWIEIGFRRVVEEEKNECD
jgi:hypothetical protein